MSRWDAYTEGCCESENTFIGFRIHPNELLIDLAHSRGSSVFDAQFLTAILVVLVDCVWE